MDIKTYLEEQKVTAVDKAATLADDYKLTHSGTRELKVKLPTLKSASVGQTSDGARNIPQLSDKGHANREDRSRKSVPTCFYCKKCGHVMAECWVLDKKEKSKVSKGTGLVAVPDNVTLSDNSLMPQAVYRPFVSQGFVLLSENNSHKEPIRILRDTGASQSLLVEGVLPLSAETATGDHVLIHGVELGYISVPMHKVFLQSDLVSGYVTVGFRPTLPVVGVSLLLGNDIAGERVTANPLMSSLPFLFDSSDQVTQDILGLYPACAVTRSMTKQKVGMPNDQVCDWMGENCSTLNDEEVEVNDCSQWRRVASESPDCGTILLS